MPLPAWGAGREVGASPVAKRVRRALPLALFLWRGSALHSRAAFETFEQSVRRMRQLFFFSQFVLQENESPASCRVERQSSPAGLWSDGHPGNCDGQRRAQGLPPLRRSKVRVKDNQKGVYYHETVVSGC